MPRVMDKAEERRWYDAAIFGPSHISWPMRFVAVALASIVISTLLVFGIEWIVRGSFSDTMQFFRTPHKPAWTTVAFFVVILTLSDALFGRIHYGLFIVGPTALLTAVIAREKSLYLGDPLYPSDFLYAHQIIDLMPLLVRDRPWSAVGLAFALLLCIALIAYATLFWWRSFDRIPWKGRVARAAFTLPLIAWFAYICDFNEYSLARDKLRLQPIIWDQTENYAHNGFTMAFILNVPMATVFAPTDYSRETMAMIEPPAQFIPVANRQDKPDVIMVMSESFWDPTRLPKVAFSVDPLPTVRSEQSGHVFSPEFGGMTANVEFEALTGFSKSFLPTGSIPYQQFIRRPMPSLASYFKTQGYATRAIHPYREWFWNRGSVYKQMGFDAFMSEETMPPLEKRGTLASDDALVTEIIKAADSTEDPFFFFAVSLQGHGPYEANRYPDSTLEVWSDDATEGARQSIRTFAQGVNDADASLERLMKWAKNRERETIVVFFGDHLPPLGPAYIETGFMQQRVASRNAAPSEMLVQHETPLVLWSNKRGAEVGVGTISPAFLPMHILEMAGMHHPYYTGFLGEVYAQYRTIDQHALFDSQGATTVNWQQQPLPSSLRNYQLLQYDMMFGENYALPRFFPSQPQS